MYSKVSVFIPTFNDESVLETCIKNARYFTDDLVICDFGSTDDTLAIANRYADKVVNFKDVSNEIFNVNGPNDNVTYLAEKFIKNKCWMLIKPTEILEGGPFLNDISYWPDYPNNIAVKAISDKEHVGYITRIRWKAADPVSGTLLSDKISLICDKADVDMVFDKSTEPLHEVFRKAMLSYNGGVYTEAMPLLRKYILYGTDSNNKAQALYTLAQCYIATLQAEKIIKPLFRMLEIDQSFCEPYVLLSKFYKDRDVEKCLAYADLAYDAAKKNKPKFMNEREVFGMAEWLNLVYYNAGRVKDALDCINKALEHYPDHANMLFNKNFYESKLGIVKEG